ncbi:MAG: LysM peptidoglycan-binding domain-containing protein [Bacteroides sp.]|nr:LysM peptidoglycan-binding domain-containing protein [Bacteroides sp.]MCM1413459.1 LysM peptidoglycan-binding domain-containing protein [Bacteroides sp.]MCM1471330.1 LysM peptidoglycan-binding domain-containing protein [Bacteroides sp.]
MTHLLKKVAAAMFCFASSLWLIAGVNELPVKTVKGKKYYYYEVKQKETIFSLCRDLGITRDELIHFNPSVRDGLKAYQILYFPVDEFIERETTTYMVRKDETGYGISRQFDMALDEFYELNPGAKNGLKAGQLVKVYVKSTKAPSESAPVAKSEGAPKPVVDKTTSEKSSGSYTIKPGETLYHIASEHGLTLQQLLDANPDLNPERYVAGQKIIIPGKSKGGEPKSSADMADGGNAYIVKDGDTFYGIARRFGISVEQLMNANPSIVILQPDMKLVLPEACAESQPDPSVEPATPAVPAAPSAPSVLASESDQGVPLIIAVALPFTDTKAKSARSQRAIEFYRGLVLAVDSMRYRGVPIRLFAFDTKGTDEGAKAIINDTHFREANLIIAPDQQSQMEPFIEYAADNHVYLMNLYQIKDQSQNQNAYVMNANIPSMNEKAIEYFMTTYSDMTPVFLKRKGGKADQADFVQSFKQALDAAKVKYHEIEFVDNLSVATLNKLPQNANYAFIPVASDSGELQKLIDAVVKYRESNAATSNAALWGYSRWLTLRNEEMVKKLHDSNTMVFSRFYNVYNDPMQESLQEKFSHWYGSRVANNIPAQGTYGFDIGMYLISALSANKGDFSKFTPAYEGIQNSFNFVRVPSGGFVNNDMYIINFAPNGITSRFKI